jgi:hypothetical protein
MRSVRLLSAGLLLSSALGCHSAYIETTIRNRTDQPVTLVELDYPSASFGTQEIAPGREFHYRFKVLGSGKLKLIYTDTARAEHDIPGPELKEGDEGLLLVTITPTGAQWQPTLRIH